MSHNTAPIDQKEHPFIFIVGAPRSGTTLLSSMLNSHSELAIPYESNFMVHCYKEYGLMPNLSDKTELMTLIDQILSGYFVSKWEPKVNKEDLNFNNCKDLPALINEIYRCYAQKKGKSIWGDKTPGYTPDINVLNHIFPNAKYIHIIRDGRDVAMSLRDRSWGPPDFISAMRYWKNLVELCQAQLSMLPAEQYLELRFEDLVKEPEFNLKRICAVLDIEYEQGMVRDYSSEWGNLPAEVRKIHTNLQGGPSEKQCFKWVTLLDRPDQAIANEIAGDLLDRHGYDVSVKNHKLKIVKKIYHWSIESIRWRLRRSRS